MEGAMQDNATPSTAGKPKPKGRDSRDDRLKSALKANMARRKAQAKARAVTGADNDKEDE
jgi:hypothetical protein